MNWLLLLFVLGAVRAEEICLTGQEEPYLLFGTKTAYIFANRNKPSTKFYEVPGCQPIAFWMLSRHGTHNPQANEMWELEHLADIQKQVLKNYINGNFWETNERICSADIDLLEQWQWNKRINLTYAGDLTSEGYLNTQELAQVYKQKFPTLLDANPRNYLFKYVDDQRSVNTFKAFSEGIFGDMAETMGITKENDEKLLRPYKFCPAWIRDVEANNDTFIQSDIYESKKEYQDMFRNISARLGYRYELHGDYIRRMYQMCRYNKAWDVAKISPWCAVFSREDLMRLEYGEDLRTYYKYGYGTELNKHIGCTLVKDMMTFLNTHVNAGDTPQRPRALIHFSSAAMLMLTLTAMGAHRDSVPLTGDNFHCNNMHDRKWTTSTMMPFNANIAAALYKCTQNGNFQVKEPYQVLLLENERPMKFEGCRVGLCDWSLVKQLFQETADKCDLEFCNGSSKLSGLMGLNFVAAVYLIRYIIRI